MDTIRGEMEEGTEKKTEKKEKVLTELDMGLVAPSGVKKYCYVCNDILSYGECSICR